MNKTKIEWCDYTWNPIVGCKRGCTYCYARKLHNMRHKAYMEGKNLPVQYAKPFEEIQFFPERLKEPLRLRKPSTIFVGSCSDLFFDGVSITWIRQIIEIIELSNFNIKDHTFMFLTKTVSAYKGWDFPFDNVWLGLTQTHGNQKEIDQFFKDSIPDDAFSVHNFFLSIEPLLGSFEGIDLTRFDKVFVGAMTGKNSTVPQLEWVKSIKHPNIMYKDNLKKIYPNL